MASWYFPPSNGGLDQGIHEAGIETFKGDSEWYLAREAIQNSVDARANLRKPVRVVFELVKLPRAEVPGLGDLADTFSRCREYWPDDQDATTFFDAASRLAATPHIHILWVSDSNTTGVSGADDDRTQGWYKLVKCRGSSGKLAGSGGSFGIGKSAQYASSGMQTVLYSTMTEDQSVAFLGLAMLVTHERDGEKLQNAGWFGGTLGQSERNPRRIPAVFRRTEPGTDLLILGYQAGRRWQDKLVSSVLENFWPAVHNRTLEVTVGGTEITAASLLGLLEQQAAAYKSFHAHQYYRAYTQPTANHADSLPTLKNVTLRLLVGESLPGKVAMVRTTGMVIYLHTVRGTSVPYCGVFECRNPTGNDLLRRMEPPAHDKWDRDRPPPNGSHRVHDELAGYLRDRVKALAPPVANQVLPVEDVNQFLPDDGDTPDDSFNQPPAGGVGTNEAPVNVVVPAPKPPPPPKPSGTDGERFFGHAFLLNAAAGVYALVVEPPAGVRRPLLLNVAAVGDDADAKADPVVFAAARLADGRTVPVPGLGRIGPVPYAGRGAVRLEATLADPDRLALRVTAWEVPSDAAE